ncbi:uncharacterized protein EI90DRAFT_779613 [Cantharellus anzutake]|uniref:uncharacterized protein n=1 Tax=Cantharellus anzutake TaxID=1750568 RepID=UPI0019069C6A|nr:uncharacterized protein EI90DRAFT_779613 [Cantharellus anzutake]KAF8342734.1 hypothetical protein EI90DRAFT_779613 [Cantharellus anzutake]
MFIFHPQSRLSLELHPNDPDKAFSDKSIDLPYIQALPARRQSSLLLFPSLFTDHHVLLPVSEQSLPSSARNHHSRSPKFACKTARQMHRGQFVPFRILSCASISPIPNSSFRFRSTSCLSATRSSVCPQVNKKLKRVIDSSLVLQYHIKLTLCGYSDGTRSPRHLATSSTTATRLKRLTKHIDSWNDLDWQMSRVRVPPAEIYELSGGVFASVYEEFLTCVRLPSHVKGTPACKWTHNLGFRPKDIAMDPQQDLLVLVQLQERRPEPDDKPGMIHAVRLHLRSLSDNGPHDEALGPILYGIENFSHRVRFQIQIMGKLLGIAYYDTLGANSQLEIWDWREGRLIVELENSQKDMVISLGLSRPSPSSVQHRLSYRAIRERLKCTTFRRVVKMISLLIHEPPFYFHLLLLP